MSTPKSVVVVASALAVSLAGDVFAQRRALELEDYYRLEHADEPALSPDGRLVAFTRHYIVEEDNRRRSEVWLGPVDGSETPRRITIESFDASEPRFSPDGELLVFRSSRNGEGPVWFLRTGAPGEAFQMAGVESLPVFSPDGGRLAFTRKTPPDTSPRERSAFERELEERFEGKIYDWMQYRFDRRGYLPDPRDPRESPPEELYVVSRDGGEPKKLTSLGVDVTGIAWSPDGRRVAITADAHQRDEHVYERADLWLVDLESNVERLTDDEYHYRDPSWSPDGTKLAFLRRKGLSAVIAEKSDRGAPLDVYVLDLASGEMINVTSEWELRPGAPRWSDDGNLSFAAGIGGNHHLFRAEAGARATVRQVTTGDRWLDDFSFTPDSRLIAFAQQTATEPSQVVVARLEDGSETKISSAEEDVLSEVRRIAPERILFESTDGAEIEGWVLLPPDYDETAKESPLILAVHGGPHGAYGNRFNFRFQLWAAEGYVVLYTNPRGSSGYGEEFLYATWEGGWGILDTDDVLSGVDHVLSRYAIDEGRLGVTGYSYGGFLTNWIITHNSRFAAAVSGAGISNWVSDYGTADIPRTKESEFYGPPWEDESGSLLERQSPIYYAESVTTPTLFIHGEIDYRVPIEQGEQMYTALVKRRVPAKFIRYPDSYHGGWTPWNTVHRYYHELQWWKEYLAPRAATSQ